MPTNEEVHDDENSTDVAKLKKAILAERAGHKVTEATLRAVRKELTEATDKLTERGALDNPTTARISEHIAASVKAGIARETAILQQQIAELQDKLAASEENGEALLGQLTSRTISEEVREAARTACVRPEAINDVLTFAAAELKVIDGKVQTADGTSLEEWLDARKASSPYLWPTARGAGARGSFGEGKVFSGDNPFKAGSGWSLTEQGRITRENPELAKQLSKQVGD